MKNIKSNILISIVILISLCFVAVFFINISDSFNDRIYLGTKIEHLKDSSGKLTFSDVLGEKSNYFIKNKTRTLNFGFTSDTYWLRFKLDKKTISENNLLEYDYPQLGSGEFYRPSADGTYSVSYFGADYPFKKREHPYTSFVFQLKESEADKFYYMKLSSETNLRIIISIMPALHFAGKTGKDLIMFGIYAGILMVMIVFNIMTYFTVRSRSYIFVILYIISFLFFEIALGGIGFQYFWSDYPLWNRISFLVFVGLAFGFISTFTRSFLETATHQPKLDKALGVISALCFICSLGLFFIKYTVMIKVLSMIAFVTLIFMLTAGFKAFFLKYRAARFYVLAFSFLFIGASAFILMIFGIIPSNYIALKSYKIGIALQALFLSLALFDKMTILTKEKESAQNEAIKNNNLALANLEKSNKLKDEFLSNISHELRTPLTGIIGLTENLTATTSQKLDFEEIYTLKTIQYSANRLANLVNDLLDFSSMRTKQISLIKKGISVSQNVQLVLNAFRPLIKNKNFKLYSKISADCPLIFADENRFQQIVYNLVDNAVKFTESGTIKVDAAVANNMIYVSVSDTGIGIDDEKKKAIFEPFTQGDGSVSRKYGGTGIGLTITKHLVELHGGKISFETKKGKGTVFHFTIPIFDGKAEEFVKAEIHHGSFVRLTEEKETVTKQEIKITPNSADKRFHVLIVDDEKVNLMVVSNHLSRENYFTDTALNGEEALEKIFSGIKYDLIILDVMMPGLSGFDVCRKIRTQFDMTKLPVIFLTAKTETSDLKEGFDAGGNDFLSKPFQKDELLARAKTHIALSKTAISAAKYIPAEFLALFKKESISEIKLGDNISMKFGIMVTNIAKFNDLAAKMSSDELYKFLNSYLKWIHPIIKENGGFIYKYQGDKFIALFPESKENALAAAKDFNAQLATYNKQRENFNYPSIKVGVGLHFGNATIGIIGSEERSEYTITGSSVSIAESLERLTRKTRKHALATSSILDEKTLPKYKTSLTENTISDSENSYQIYEFYGNGE